MICGNKAHLSWADQHCRLAESQGTEAKIATWEEVQKTKQIIFNKQSRIATQVCELYRKAVRGKEST